MLMKRLVCGFVFVFLLLLPAAAVQYDLDALVDVMRANNTELRKADETVVQSQLDVKDAKAAYHPAVDLTLMGMYMPDPLVGDITVNTNDILAQMGQPPAAQGYDITLYDGLESTYYGASLSLTQPLITWGKIPNSVKLYETVAGAREVERSDKENRLIAELKARLSALYYMEMVEDLLVQTEADAQSLADIARSGEEEGALLSADVLDAEIQAKQAGLALRELEVQRTEVLQGLRTMTGLDDLSPENISFVPDEDDISLILSYSPESLVSLAISPSSPVLQMLSSSEEALEYGRKIAKASMYGIPDIALQLSASYGGSRLPFIEKNWSRKNDWNLMITVAFKTTLWDGGKILNNIDRIDSQIASSKADYDAAVDTLESTVVNTYAAMDLSAAKAEYLELKIENGNRDVEDAVMKREAGAAADSDVLTSRLALIEDEISLLTEKMSLFQNCYTLCYLTGLDPENPPVITDGMADNANAV